MRLNIRNWKSTVLVQVISTILLANFTFAGANSQALQIAAGNNAKVKGSILSRNGDLIRVREKKHFFDADSAVLKEEAKPALADLARTAKSLDGYIIKISGYAANTQNKRIDYQKLSE